MAAVVIMCPRPPRGPRSLLEGAQLCHLDLTIDSFSRELEMHPLLGEKENKEDHC